MRIRIISILFLCVILLQCVGCASKNETPAVEVHLPKRLETTVVLPDETAKYITRLWGGGRWSLGDPKYSHDYVLLFDGSTYRYTSDMGLFIDVENNRYHYLTETQRMKVNFLLGIATLRYSVSPWIAAVVVGLVLIAGAGVVTVLVLKKKRRAAAPQPPEAEYPENGD